MKKRLISLFIVLGVMLSSAAVPFTSYASDALTPVNVNVNFCHIPFESPAVTVQGVTMVPVEELCKIMWYDFEMKSADGKFVTKRVKHDKTIIWQEGSDIISVNGAETKINGCPRLIDGKMFIPLRAFCDAVGFEIEWNAQENAVYYYTDTKEIMEKMEMIDAWCSGDVVDFVLDLYDPETGLFYYTKSAKENSQFGPGIESTSCCLSLLEKGKPLGFTGNIYDALPENFKEKALNTLLSWQSEEDGYFYVPWQSKNQSNAKRERDLSHAKSVITRLGGKPLYKLPSERLAEALANKGTKESEEILSTMPIQYTSETEMLKWLNSFNWSSPYSTLHQISASFGTIKAAGLGDFVRDYVTARQNPETGLWGDGVDYDGTDAALKASPLYDQKHPYPNFEKMVYSVLQTLKENKNPDNVCIIWNPLTLLNSAIATYEYKIPQEIRDIIHEKLPEIIETTINNLLPYKKEGGGLSYYVSYTPSKAQGSRNGLGLAEGNVDHTLIGTHNVRSSLLDLANYSIITPIYEDRWEEIYNTLASDEPYVKPERTIGCDKNFEDCTIGGKLPWDVIDACKAGSVEIVNDPYRNNNKALRLIAAPGGTSAFNIIAQSYDDSKKITLEMDFCIEALAKGSSGFNEIGDLDGVQWCITSPDGKTWSLCNRTNQAGVGTVLKSGLEMMKWYRLKIVYEPRGIDDTEITFYVDGKIVGRTNKYYNGDVASALPAKRIERLVFNPFLAAQGTLYYDNVRLTAER